MTQSVNLNTPVATDTGAPQCPVCKSLQISHLCKVDGFDVWRCPESATDFVSPMPSDATLKKLYDREEWFEGGERGGYSDYDAQTEPSLHATAELLARFDGATRDLHVLDIGCGYGSHLKLAADKGWKCFGVEPSEHARGVAQQRHGDRMTIVEKTEDLFPVAFDLILMYEVIEHLTDPYKLFFTLFGRGMITPETLVIVSTPNARSGDAVANPAGWAYRHPPSHLVFYSAKSLQLLLQRLLFKDITVRGIVPKADMAHARFEDESASVNNGQEGFVGVLAEARGSTFKEFMHERYVPDGFWKLTEYEHFPRYGLAAQMAKGMRVLDFGCGTGYGTARLAGTAASVVGMDISPEAIAWARAMHRDPTIRFEERSDLGRGLGKGVFDLITCFEMIEHVDHTTQIETIHNAAELLTPGGKLVISTPDPRFTAPYGPNPYHLREMTEAEFMELLSASFKHVVMLKQWVRPSVLIALESLPPAGTTSFDKLTHGEDHELPIGFVAICSNAPIDQTFELCQFETAFDANRQAIDTENKLNVLRYQNYGLTEIKRGHERYISDLQNRVEALNEIITAERARSVALQGTVLEGEQAIAHLQTQVVPALESTIQHLENTVQHLESTVQHLGRTVQHLEWQNQGQAEYIGALKAERSLILNSLSWKITRPLRFLRRTLLARPIAAMRSRLPVVQGLPVLAPQPPSQPPAVQQPHDAQTTPALPAVLHPDPEKLGAKHKILLVVHEFSRTGAPRAVLYLARALFAMTGVAPVVISFLDGPIREEFESEGFPTLVDHRLTASAYEAPDAAALVAGFERVIVTPITAYAFIRHFKGIAKRVAWWIHEEQQGFDYIVTNVAPDLAALFAACEQVWLGSPLSSAPALRYTPQDKAHLLLYGCDDIALPHQPHRSGKMVFTIVGTVEPRKGQDIFLDAIARLPAELRNKAVFRIIGSSHNDGASDFLDTVRARGGAMSEVELFPNIPFQQLRELYAQTDVVVCASRADPMPIAVTQGLMFSTACLCASVIGHAGLLKDGEDGLLFASESADALAAQMAWAIQHPDELHAIGAAGRKVFEEHFLMSSFVGNVQHLLGSHHDKS